MSRIRRASRRNLRKAKPPVPATVHADPLPDLAADDAGPYVTPLAMRYDDVLKNSISNINAAMVDRSPTASPLPRRGRSLSPSLRRAEYGAAEDRHGDIEPEYEFCSETMSELGSVDIPEPAESGAYCYLLY